VSDELQGLVDHIGRWRSAGVDEYWVRVDYIGSALNRMGDHVLTQAKGAFWHQWHGDWRKIEPGSDYWLFSVPGAFAWTREMLSAVGSSEDSESPIQLEFDDQYGFVKKLRVKMPERDAANFTFEVKDFGVGTHPDFDQ
jgi:hypothetical protein